MVAVAAAAAATTPNRQGRVPDASQPVLSVQGGRALFLHGGVPYFANCRPATAADHKYNAPMLHTFRVK